MYADGFKYWLAYKKKNTRLVNFKGFLFIFSLNGSRRPSE